MALPTRGVLRAQRVPEPRPATAAVVPAVVDEAVCRPAPDPAAEAAADLHLLRRATWGPTPELVQEVSAVGREAWVDRQLAPRHVEDAACDAVLARLPQAALSSAAAWGGGVERYAWTGMFALGQATLVRQAWSRRQLLEVVVDVLSDHLHVASPSDDVWYCRMDYDTTVLRRHALGRFEDALVASAQHPAMLWFLDNARSTKRAPNENYGRELLELHTVGVDAGYTEADVVACARLLTGMTVDRASGLHVFRPTQHDTSAVRVMDWSAPAHAAADGAALQVSLLRHLARHPATARHLVTKLARRLVADDPPAALVDRLARVYLDGGTAIAPVVRELLLAPDALAASTPKTKRPREDLVSALRALGHRPDATGTQGVASLYWMVRSRGHAPADWAPPNGFPDVAGAWASASGSLAAWDHHLELSSAWWPKGLGFTAARDLLPAAPPATVGALVDALALRLLHEPLAPTERAAVVAFTGRAALSPLRGDDEWLGWRLASLACLVLDSPSFATR
ncbi:DUF1800 domain-containing protein [uncultured Pseudokineococcus sp.]|uniref:DUF1800 domain-containing protein n=1 Tax=uncultured Pseudokineococcus sp. TaxID=1642928 RepID=UPI0026308E16|nr:DUF1800 domain-containing protein [uncultured Pseudokineococcus sp.]